MNHAYRCGARRRLDRWRQTTNPTIPITMINNESGVPPERDASASGAPARKGWWQRKLGGE